MTGSEIKKVLFDKAKHGYDVIQVDNLLDQLADQIDLLQKEKDDLEYKMQILAEKIQEYKKEEENIHQALLDAQRMKTSIIEDANKQAEEKIKDATEKSESLLAQARQKLKTLADESKGEIQRNIDTLKRENLKYERLLERSKNADIEFRKKITSEYRAHLQFLSSISDEDVEKQDTKTKEETPHIEENVDVEKNSEETVEQTSFFKADENENADEIKAAVDEIDISDTKVIENTDFENTEEDTVHTEDEILSEENIKEDKTEQKHKKASFVEKFGELKFGEYNTDK